jgi:hypothetical protein
MKSVKLILLFSIFLLFSVCLQAQLPSDSEMVKIETRDGNEFIGSITSEDSEKIILATESLGEIVILKKNIKSQQLILPGNMRNGKLWFANPQSSRYFWAPNAYGLQKGEGYYQNIWVLWNQFAYGITDNFSLGGGIIPLFLFAGGPTPVFITPKVSIPVDKDKFNIGAGALIGTVLGQTESGFGIVYGVTTFGSPEKNVSIGLGYGFAGGEWSSSPLINMGGMLRISPSWYLISENYYAASDGESGGILSGGARWIIKKAALDFGLFIPVGTGGSFVGIPWLGFTIPFGNVK